MISDSDHQSNPDANHTTNTSSQPATVITNGRISKISGSPSMLTISSSWSKQVKPNGFMVKYYDNAKGEWFEATYKWKLTKMLQVAD